MPAVSICVAKAITVAGIVVMDVVRRPYMKRASALRVVANRTGMLDNTLVALVSVGFFLPVLWLATPVLAFADYALRPIPFGAGVVCLAGGLWLLQQSHVDLGTNWSHALEFREGHQLVTHGVYRRVRHPMYLALLLYAVGQALVLPNSIAGPFFLIAFALLVAIRIGPEERMMLGKFGAHYEAYMARTRRLVPGVW